MRLTAFRTNGQHDAAPLRPASPRRQWMDDTLNRFAYRCLPITIGNQFGWEVLCMSSFEALWLGGPSTQAVQIIRLDDGPGPLPQSHFGSGILTFHPGWLFRTDAPYCLYVTGPTNHRKDGIAPLTGIVETHWVPFTFTMNWIFTRVGVPVRFEAGEPFCHFFPVEPAVLETAEPACAEISSEPSLEQAYRNWTTSREGFIAELTKPGTEASRQGWQKNYSRGTSLAGESVAAEHRTKMRIRPFEDVDQLSFGSLTGAEPCPSRE